MPDPTSPDRPDADPAGPTEPIEPVEPVEPVDSTRPIESVSSDAADVPSAPGDVAGTHAPQPTAGAAPETYPATAASAAPAAAGTPAPAAAAAPRGPRFAGARRLWGEATASTGARVATIIALALATVVVIGGLTSAAVALARHGDNRGPDQRMGQEFGKGRPDGGVGGRQLPGGGSGPGLPGNDQNRPGPLGGAGRGGGLGPGTAGSLHGEFTQGQPATTYVFQRGTVTASSATSLAVKSADGFTATYAVSDSTRVRGARAAQVSVGSQVLVIATKQGAAAVRVQVIPAGAGVMPNGTT